MLQNWWQTLNYVSKNLREWKEDKYKTVTIKHLDVYIHTAENQRGNLEGNQRGKKTCLQK